MQIICEFVGFTSHTVAVSFLWQMAPRHRAIYERFFFLDISTIVDATITLSRNVGHQSIGDAATHSRITETSSDNLTKELTN